MKTAARFALLAAGLALAVPAFAAPLSDDETEALLGRVMTPAGDACHKSWDEGASESADQILAKCQAAITEVQGLRAREGALSPGVRTIYSQVEAMLEQGIVVSYTRQDGDHAAQMCQHEERIGLLLNEGDPASVSKDISAVMIDYKRVTGEVLIECRKRFGTPAGGVKL